MSSKKIDRDTEAQEMSESGTTSKGKGGVVRRGQKRSRETESVHDGNESSSSKRPRHAEEEEEEISEVAVATETISENTRETIRKAVEEEVKAHLIKDGWTKWHNPEEDGDLADWLSDFVRALDVVYLVCQVVVGRDGKWQNRIQSVLGPRSEIWISALSPNNFKKRMSVIIRTSTSPYQDAIVQVVQASNPRAQYIVTSPPGIAYSNNISGVGYAATSSDTMDDPTKNAFQLSLTSNETGLVPDDLPVSEGGELHTKEINFLQKVFLKQMKDVDRHIIDCTYWEERLHKEQKKAIFDFICENILERYQQDDIKNSGKSPWKRIGQNNFSYNGTPLTVQSMIDPTSEWLKATNERYGVLGQLILNKHYEHQKRSSYSPMPELSEDGKPIYEVEHRRWQSDTYVILSLRCPVWKRGDTAPVNPYGLGTTAPEVQKGSLDPGTIIEVVSNAGRTQKLVRGQPVFDASGNPVYEQNVKYNPPVIEIVGGNPRIPRKVPVPIPAPGTPLREVRASDPCGRFSTVCAVFGFGFSETKKGFYVRHALKGVTILNYRAPSTVDRQSIEYGEIVSGDSTDAQVTFPVSDRSTW